MEKSLILKIILNYRKYLTWQGMRGTLGKCYALGERVHNILKDELNFNATLINPRFASGIDEKMLSDLLTMHQLVITLEDGVLDGGFGEKISRFYGDKPMKVLNYGAIKEFTDRIDLAILKEKYHMREDLIIEDIKQTLNL